MKDNVVSISNSEIQNTRRESFVQAVALSFDLYVKDHGVEPDAIVYVLNGLTKPSRIAWDMHGDSRDGGSAVLAFAAAHVQAEIVSRLDRL